MNEIWAEIKERFRKGDVLTRLIFVNGAGFVLMLLFQIVYGLVTAESFGFSKGIFQHFLGLPLNNFEGFLYKPYTILTHFFIHHDILHVGFNMLLLYFLGKLFLNYFSQKQFLGLYMMGGLITGLGLILATTLSPLFTASVPAVGASAAVMSIVIGITFYAPNTIVRLFGVIPIKLMWVGIFMVVQDLLKFDQSNTAGHLGHLIGAGVGYWFAASFKQGKDITQWMTKLINTVNGIFKPKPKMKVVYNQQKVRKMTDEEYNVNQKVTQSEIDSILDKISASGYSSLTKREKDILFQYSNKK